MCVCSAALFWAEATGVGVAHKKLTISWKTNSGHALAESDRTASVLDGSHGAGHGYEILLLYHQL